MSPCGVPLPPPAATPVDPSWAISESARGCLSLREGPEGAHSFTLAAAHANTLVQPIVDYRIGQRQVTELAVAIGPPQPS
jgi:hypothetical protein